MKLKLAALLSFLVLGLAGCSADYRSSNNANAPATNNANTATAPTTTAQNNPNIVEANADPTGNSGGTKEGCKCSAVGMKCNTKDGEKGCCGGKDGGCSTMKDGVSACCASDGGKDGACCSTAKTTAMTDHKDMKGMDNKGGMEKKADQTPAAPTKKS